jgi:hypothetical protein
VAEREAPQVAAPLDMKKSIVATARNNFCF